MTKIKAKHPIKYGKTLIPKGTEGFVKAISNSIKIKETFPFLKHEPDGWFYIVQFPNTEELLCVLSEIEFI